jgi:D-tyrosyl-tRNA(Tyr) deacylase
VVQRTLQSAVTVDGVITGAIPRGLCVFLGVGPGDDEAIADKLASRIATLRIFPDDDGRMNLDVAQAGGEVLAISQFTLFADTSRGHRPSFLKAAPPDQAARLYDAFVDALRKAGLTVATGVFGAHMDIDVRNDGPVTLVLTSGEDAWPADAG